MKKFKYYLLLAVLIFASCSDDEEPVQILKNLKVTVGEITTVSAKIKMSAEISDNSPLVYEIFLAEKPIKKVSENEFLLTNLLPATEYKGEVYAISKQGKKISKKFSFKTKGEKPADFKISISDITSSSVKLTWEKSKLISEVLYTVKINNKEYVKDIKENEIEVKKLDAFTEYDVEIIARIGEQSTSSKTSFKTLGIKPSNFKIISPNNNETVNPDEVIIKWEEPKLYDNSSIDEYLVYLDGDNYSTYNNKYSLYDLEEGHTYTLKVQAVSTNGLKSETEEIKFKTLIFTNPSDFDIKVKSVTKESISIEWNPSVAEGQTVEYIVYLNDKKKRTTEKTEYDFKNLDINTEYLIKVVASTNKGKTTEKEIKVSTLDYKVHPTIIIDKAKLFTKNSKYFGGQLALYFNTEVKEFTPNGIYIGELVIRNYMIYPESIMTGVLDDDKYAKILEAKKGYFMIKQNGEDYKVLFTVEEVTN